MERRRHMRSLCHLFVRLRVSLDVSEQCCKNRVLADSGTGNYERKLPRRQSEKIGCTRMDSRYRCMVLRFVMSNWHEYRRRRYEYKRKHADGG